MSKRSADAYITLGDVLGATPEKCVQILGLRPLLAGAAWKVLDLLVEAALGQPGKKWRIEEKVSQARSGISGPPNFGKATWDALATTYANIAEVRHSLVHRQAHLDASEALVGLDRTGRPLTPLSSAAQEALARAAVRASSLALAPSANARIEGDLLRHLRALAAWHGVQLPTAPELGPLREISVLIDPDQGSPTYVFDVPALKDLLKLEPNCAADLIIILRGRSGQEFRGWLEDVPDARVSIDPDNPPDWLH